MIEEIKKIANTAKLKIIYKKYILIPIFLAIFAYIGISILTPLASAQTVCGVTSTLVSGLFGTPVPAIVCTICTILGDVELIILVLSLALICLGGVMYAGAHILPGQQRGAMLGYGFGMIIGGVVGLIIVFIAPFIVNTIINVSGITIPSLINTIIPGVTTATSITTICTLISSA